MLRRAEPTSNEFKLASGFERLTRGLCDLPNAPLDQVQHFQSKGCDRALDFAGVGHYVRGFSNMDHRDRHYPRIYRPFIARYNALE
jgi:hypothetical protein